MTEHTNIEIPVDERGLTAEQRRAGWRYTSCQSCKASGCADGFDGIASCRVCDGNGGYYVTPTGRHVAYPGGPFV